MSRRPRGITLIEQLIASTMFVMLLGVGQQLIIPTLSAWQVNRARASVEQTYWVVARKMTQELARSDYSSVTTQSSSAATPPAISFLSYGDESSPTAFDPLSGNTVYSEFVIYYVDTENDVLYRKTFSGGEVPGSSDVALPATQAFALSSAQLLTLCTTTNGTETPVGYGIENLAVTAPTSGALTLDMTLTAQEGSETVTVHRYTGVEVNN